ncbi:MAG: cyclic nucleotide-binding domain-containing protein [Deltaproteobacteria bacterium]|nr:cyclic nucleotide-binding domain-containing protein [Deltaproteobacteria bacterium]
METLIRNSHLFKSLDDEGRMRALLESSLARFAAGAVILREGEPGDDFYLIADGTVRVETRRGEGTDDSVELATLGRGAFFGEVAVLTGRPRTATVTAAEELLVVVFSRALVERLLDAYPRVRRLLETMVLGRARDTIEKISSR